MSRNTSLPWPAASTLSASGGGNRLRGMTTRRRCPAALAFASCIKQSLIWSATSVSSRLRLQARHGSIRQAGHDADAKPRSSRVTSHLPRLHRSKVCSSGRLVARCCACVSSNAQNFFDRMRVRPCGRRSCRSTARTGSAAYHSSASQLTLRRA